MIDDGCPSHVNFVIFGINEGKRLTILGNQYTYNLELKLAKWHSTYDKIVRMDIETTACDVLIPFEPKPVAHLRWQPVR